jgi:hypothetical protein
VLLDFLPHVLQTIFLGTGYPSSGSTHVLPPKLSTAALARSRQPWQHRRNRTSAPKTPIAASAIASPSPCRRSLAFPSPDAFSTAPWVARQSVSPAAMIALSCRAHIGRKTGLDSDKKAAFWAAFPASYDVASCKVTNCSVRRAPIRPSRSCSQCGRDARSLIVFPCLQ